MDTPTKLSDEWQTPQWLFDELDKEFAFNIDLCSTSENKKCPNRYTDLLIIDALPKVFPTHHSGYDTPRCFMNPPYSNPKPFVEKAWELSNGGVIVCLLKCDPSTRWWAIFWDHEKHRPRHGCEVRFLPKRVKFDPPIGYTGKVTTPAFPSAVIIFDRRYTGLQG